MTSSDWRRATLISLNNAPTFLISCRYLFKPYQKIPDDDDEEEEQVDILDDVDEEIVDAEQVLSQDSEVNDAVSNEDDGTTTSSNVDIALFSSLTAMEEDDEFISEDEDESQATDPSAGVRTFSSGEVKKIWNALEQTNVLMARVRKLVNIMRSIAAIDHFIRNHQDGPPNGFVIDMRVSANDLF